MKLTNMIIKKWIDVCLTMMINGIDELMSCLMMKILIDQWPAIRRLFMGFDWLSNCDDIK